MNKLPKSLAGKCVLITGGNAGIGYWTAKGLAQRGARVIIACRNEERAIEAITKLKEETKNEDIVFKKLNLSSLKDVKSFSEEILQSENRLDVLLLNAGIWGGNRREVSEDGIELVFATNHLGHFYLTNQLTPLLLKSAPSRVVIVSSVAHKMGTGVLEDIQLEKNYSRIKAYGKSKLCNILHCRELAMRMKDSNVLVNCLHPGIVSTGLLKGMSYNWLIAWFGRSPQKGAETSIYLAASEEVKDTGEYFADCRIATTVTEAKNDEVARKLWEISQRLVDGALSE